MTSFSFPSEEDLSRFDKAQYRYTFTNTMGFDEYDRICGDIFEFVKTETTGCEFRVNDCAYIGFNDSEEASVFRLKFGNLIKPCNR